jgi:protein-S-isoprenylcysteine O-methyltransferase Ste14
MLPRERQSSGASARRTAGNLKYSLSRQVKSRRSRSQEGKNMKLKLLVGSGEKIGLLVLPFLIAGLALNIIFPSVFRVGGPSTALQVVSIIILIPGVIIWIWSIVLILTRVPKNELITYGPYSLVKHPLYTGVALLVLPWVGFLVNTWLGALIGVVLYIGSRIFSPEEEETLSKTFGTTWDEYCHKVKIPWL